MSDLTYCYLHMSKNDLLILDTLDPLRLENKYVAGEIPDEELKIPPHMVPPNPDDTDILPSEVHPSYPYGNPTNIKHPAARPRAPHDPASRALFEDMAYAGGGVNGALRWKDLALDGLLPFDYERAEAERAVQARRMASGAAPNNAPPPAQRPGEAQGAVGQTTFDETDEDDDEGDDDDEDDEDEDEYDEDEVSWGGPEI